MGNWVLNSHRFCSIVSLFTLLPLSVVAGLNTEKLVVKYSSLSLKVYHSGVICLAVKFWLALIIVLHKNVCIKRRKNVGHGLQHINCLRWSKHYLYFTLTRIRKKEIKRKNKSAFGGARTNDPMISKIEFVPVFEPSQPLNLTGFPQQKVSYLFGITDAHTVWRA